VSTQRTGHTTVRCRARTTRAFWAGIR
jgi:hypothetical protein